MDSRSVKDWLDLTGTKRQSLANALGVDLSTLWRVLSRDRMPQSYSLAIAKVIQDNPKGLGPPKAGPYSIGATG